MVEREKSSVFKRQLKSIELVAIVISALVLALVAGNSLSRGKSDPYTLDPKAPMIGDFGLQHIDTR